MKNAARFPAWLEAVIPAFVLFLLSLFTYEWFFQNPYAGFEIANDKVSLIFVRIPGSDSLQVGDRLIKVGEVKFADFSQNLRTRLFENTSKGQVVTIVIERNERPISINWILPGPTREQILEDLNSQWWFAYVFWFAGTTALLLIRPRNIRWLLFVFFTYLTAIWLGAGSGPSHWHLGQSAIILRSAVWLSLPVYLHFHWLFPRGLFKLPRILWVIFYLGAALMALLEWFQIPPASLYSLVLAITMFSSILLLILHYLLQPDIRQDILLLLASVILTISPLIIISLALLLGSKPSFVLQGGAFLALPAVPGAYFYAMFRQQNKALIYRIRRVARIYLLVILISVALVTSLSILVSRFDLMQYTFFLGLFSIFFASTISVLTFFPFLILPALAESTLKPSQAVGLRLRANRLISYYLFFTLAGMLFAVILLVADYALNFPGEATVFGILTGISGGIVTMVGLKPFQRWIEHGLLGMPLPPIKLLETYSSKITTSLELQKLVHLIQDEVLPTLLVRQSALVKISGPNSMDVIFALGLDKDQLQSTDLLKNLPEHGLRTHRLMEPGDLPDPLSWLRIIIPLQIENRIVGAWLLGSRDPDDYFAETELPTLETIANQTAIALVNIDQAERLHALLKADIQRQDSERNQLARVLHDVVLNQLGALSMRVKGQGDGYGLQQEFQHTIDQLREIVKDLRPAMLSFGLFLGLAEMVDQLNDRGLDGMSIDLEVPPTNCRYDPNTEQNLFWIVHQACDNAIRHANASKITISGVLENDKINLVIEDDGTGFSSEDRFDIPNLLVAKHYGLVGMYERADLIGARLHVDSSSEHGTRVSVELSFESP